MKNPRPLIATLITACIMIGGSVFISGPGSPDAVGAPLRPTSTVTQTVTTTVTQTVTQTVTTTVTAPPVTTTVTTTVTQSAQVQPKWGSTPNGSNSIAQTLQKWPGSQSMRLFTSSGAGPPSGLPDIPIISWSNKPPLPCPTYVNPTIPLPASTTQFIWTPWHEIDGKVAQGTVNLADWQSCMAHIASQPDGPRIKLGIITTAWGITPTSCGGGGRDWHNYIVPGVTEWGIDFDGLGPSGSSYPNGVFLCTLNVISEIQAAGYRVSVPEFGSPLASWDPNGTARAQWMLDWAQRFRDAGLHYVCLFDNSNIEPQTGTPYSVNDQAGIDAWRSVIAS